LPNLITIVSTVATLMATGALVGRWLNMYPIEAAVINACHSGQGGTGDVAILTAANRMQLMPFAQIATRIGGAITVTVVLIFLSRLSSAIWRCQRTALPCKHRIIPDFLAITKLRPASAWRNAATNCAEPVIG
jgi:hypothetical protein